MSVDQKEMERLAVEYQTAARDMHIVNSQLGSCAQALRRAQLTSAELEGLPSETNTYKAVGRMFVKLPLDKVMDDVGEVMKECAEKQKALERNKLAVEKALKQKQQNFEEAMRSQK